MLAVKLLALLTIAVAVLHCYSVGAPSSSCDSMRPFHGYYSKMMRGNANSPYVITTDTLTYTPGQTIRVTISLKNKKTRGDEFRGFMLSARAEGGQSDKFGSFIIEPKERHKYQTKCSNMVLTHRTARKRKQVVVDFKLDDKFVTDFKFVATVVKRFSAIYMDLESEPLSLLTYTSAPPPTLPHLTIPSAELAGMMFYPVNGTNSTDISRCDESLMAPLSAEFPQVAILCTTSGGQCPCGWQCCSRCDRSTCSGHSICRRPLSLNNNNNNGTLQFTG